MRVVDSDQKKGAGYFAKRLKESGVKPAEKVDAVPADKQPVSAAGQIFEESTKSIASMAGDMSETAKMASSMREGIQRVRKLANILNSENPLCDENGCSYDGVSFSNETTQEPAVETKAGGTVTLSLKDEEKIASLIADYAKKNLSDIKADTDQIRNELQEFRDNLKRKEADLVQFREQVNHARTVTSISDNTDQDSKNQGDLQQFSEFDVATSAGSVGLSSVDETHEFDKFATIQRQIKEGEKTLLELRWKIKKAELEYQQKDLRKEKIDDLEAKIRELEAKRDQLQIEVKNLESQNRAPKEELRELEQKIKQAEKEYEEKIAAKRELDDVRSILDYLKLDKEALKSDLEDLRSKIKQAEKEYEEKKSARDQLEDVRFDVSALKAEKDTLVAEIEQLNTRIKKAEAEYEEKKAEKEKMGELKAVITHLKIEKDVIEGELAELRAKMKKAELEYQQKRAAIEELQEVREIIAYLKPERDSLKSELEQLRDRIQKTQDVYDQINAKKRELQLEYDELKFKLRKAESEFEAKKDFSRFSR
ncbi:MAG: hypothetical protein QW177_01705 [Candidatus Nitrosotenuis sp.]